MAWLRGAHAEKIIPWKLLAKERQNIVNSFMTQFSKGKDGAKDLLNYIEKNGVPKGLDKEAFKSYRSQITSVGGGKDATKNSEVYQTRVKILELILE